MMFMLGSFLRYPYAYKGAVQKFRPVFAEKAADIILVWEVL